MDDTQNEPYTPPAGVVLGTVAELTLGKPGRTADYFTGGDPGDIYPSTSN